MGTDTVVSGDDVDGSGSDVETGATVSTVVSVVSALAMPAGMTMPASAMSETMWGRFFIVDEIVIAELLL